MMGSGRAEALALYGGDPLKTAMGLMTDAMVTGPDRFLAREMAATGAPVFLYHFSYVPAAQRGSVPGAAHSAELAYVFGNLPTDAPGFAGGGPALDPGGLGQMTRTHEFQAMTDPSSSSPEERRLSNAMMAYWVAFAKTGDPGEAGGARWPRYTLAADQLLEFGADGIHARAGFEKARLDWLAEHVAPAIDP
jgi:para-nitrobenzyl esterase